MGNVAASGGYWVSTPGDRIFAEPETITGSIGIFGVIPTFEDALAEYGVTSDGVRTTPLSGQPDLLGGFTPETDALLQKTVEFGYQRFLTLVSASRKLTPERVDELGQGRVWDGGSARQLGLVDQFGDLDAALEWAAAQADLKKGGWFPKYLSDPQSAFDSTLLALLFDDNSEATPANDMFGYFAGRRAATGDRLLAGLDRLMGVRGMQALCLECPTPAPPRTDRRRRVAAPSDLGAILARLLRD
jgi:protease-4